MSPLRYQKWEVGVSLMRNGKILATGENVSLGTVNKSKVSLGLSATYGQTGIYRNVAWSDLPHRKTRLKC